MAILQCVCLLSGREMALFSLCIVILIYSYHELNLGYVYVKMCDCNGFYLYNYDFE